jgi:C-terminal processing protease CtpA/Prc
MKTIIVTGFVLISMLFIGFGASFENLKRLEASAQADSSNNDNTQILDQLITNLTQAQNTVSNNNSELATTQLTSIIGELSDIIGKITTDDDGKYLDTHTHFFNHKGHAHTVTHTHPHHADHHSHHESWFDKHHIFDPSNCKPGLMC